MNTKSNQTDTHQQFTDTAAKEKWLDKKHTKNLLNKTCSQHPFCNIQYQWCDQSNKLKYLNCPVCMFQGQPLHNIILPENQQRGKIVTYNRITEQDLDDWIAQSLNRNIKSMLNPQKKFYIQKSLEKQLKKRYKFMKFKSFKLQSLQQQLYFPPTVKRKKQNRLMSKSHKKQINYLQLKVDQNKLVPHWDSKGTPIRIRQQQRLMQQLKKSSKKGQKQKIELIEQTNFSKKNINIHKIEKLKKVKKIKQTQLQQKVQQINQNTPEKQTKNSIYSYNMQNMFRKNIIEPVQCSIIQEELQRMHNQANVKSFGFSQNQLVAKFSKLQQNYKNEINKKAALATKQMMQIINPNKKNEQTAADKFQANTKQSNIISSSNVININMLGPKSSLLASTIKKQEILPQQNNKNLQVKVKNLLNDTQLISENLDPELLSFEIHSTEIIIQRLQGSQLPQIKWLIKGQQKIRQKKYQLAIDCYKQSLMKNYNCFTAVYNIASLLQKISLMTYAKKWFQLAFQFNQQRQKVLFGLSIVCFKKSEFKQSKIYIDIIIKAYDSKPDSAALVYYYFRALAHKKLGMLQNSQQDYKKIQSHIIPINYNILSNLMFSLLFSKKRRLQVNFNCLTYMRFRQTAQYILNQPMKLVLQDSKILEDHANLQLIAIKFSKLTFFKRFPVSVVKKLLAKCIYKKLPSKSILSVRDNETFIILSGQIILKNHQKQFLRPQYIGLFTQGDVIGAGQLEKFLSQKPNLWYSTQTQVEFLISNRDDFASFWKAQFTLQLDQKYVFIKNVRIFQKLSQVSLLKLCEAFQKKTYKQGAILYNDSTYRNKNMEYIVQGFDLGQKIIDDSIGKSNDSKNLKYPGLYVLLKGVIRIQDDNNFKTTQFISPGDYFGQNLIFQSKGFQKFGKIIVHSQQAQCYFLSLDHIDKIITYDKETIAISNNERKDIETLEYIYRRFHQVQKIKLESRQQIRKIKDL